VISLSPAHANALRAYVLASLNLDERAQPISPAPFSAATVLWLNRDHPTPPARYAMLRELTNVPRGPIERIPVTEPAVPGSPEFVIYHREPQEIAISVIVVAKLEGLSPRIADTAGAILKRVRSRLETELTTPMRELGCVPCRYGQITPLDRLTRGTQWESRASFDLTLAVTHIVEEAPEWIESLDGEGTLDPLDPIAFSASTDD
jgi:hypothetical protein